MPPYKGQAWITNPKNTLHPLVDQAFMGEYPAGSTFKPFTAAQAGRRASSARARRSTARPASRGPATPANGVQQLGPGLDRHDQPEHRARGLLRHVLLPDRQRVLQPRSRRRCSRATCASSASARPPPIDIRGADPGLVPDRLWREQNVLGTRRIDQSGIPATTSTWRSARATCWSARCSWRPPTARWPTAASCPRRTSAKELVNPAHEPGGCCNRPRRSATCTSRRSSCRGPPGPLRGGALGVGHLGAGGRELPAGDGG